MKIIRIKNYMQKQNTKRKLLFIAAHPDDDSLVGGTLLQLAKNGWGLYEFVCTTGKTARPLTKEKVIGLADNRKKETELFCDLVGAQKPIFFDDESTMLQTNEKIVYALIKEIRFIRPDIIVLLSDTDYHFEHSASHDIALLAIENAFRDVYPELGQKLVNGIFLETDGLNVMNNPLITFDISGVYEKKKSIVDKAYGKRLGGNVSRFDSALAELRGARVGTGQAEVYNLLNPRWYKFTPESAKILSEFTELGSFIQ